MEKFLSFQEKLKTIKNKFTINLWNSIKKISKLKTPLMTKAGQMMIRWRVWILILYRRDLKSWYSLREAILRYASLLRLKCKLSSHKFLIIRIILRRNQSWYLREIKPLNPCNSWAWVGEVVSSTNYPHNHKKK